MKTKALLIAAIFAVAGAHAADFSLSVPTFAGNPAGRIRVPVELSSAAGLASIRVQVNFDPALLVLEDAQAGALGKQFEFSYLVNAGTVTLMFVRSTNLVSGNGSLAELVFSANSGATTDLFSDLTIARFEVGDSTGVVDLAASKSLQTINGGVQISNSATIDNRFNGMPDAWEELHGLNPLTSTAMQDSDNDGVPDIMEFAFSGNPRQPDARQSQPKLDSATIGNSKYLTLGFRRPVNYGAVIYEVQESSDLIHWTTRSLAESLAASPSPRGDGTEDVTARASQPVGQSKKQFLRVRLRW